MKVPAAPGPGSSRAAPELPPAVAAFLRSYEAGPGADEQSAGHADVAPAVARMRMGRFPFAFGTIDDFLPDELYRAALADWPDASMVTGVLGPQYGRPSSHFTGGRRERCTLETWETGTRVTVPPWDRIRSALRSPAFVRALFTAFADTVESSLVTLDPRTYRSTSFRLFAMMDNGSGEALGAHLDALGKLITLVVYMDVRGGLTGSSPSKWGTALYEMKPGEMQPTTFSPNSGRRVAQQIEFRPNRAFVMPNTSHTLHGVVGGEDGVCRRTLMCGYWVLPRE